MNRFWWWLAGGATLLWGIKTLADKKKVLGEMTVDITFTPLPMDPNTDVPSQEVLKVIDAVVTPAEHAGPCPGMPRITTKTGEPKIVSKNPPSTTVRMTYMAEWTHDRLGVLKAQAMECLLRQLKTVEPKVTSVIATRIS